MGGLLAAAAAAFSPYLTFNSLARGALPETLALGLLPWTLWAFYRLAHKPGRAIFIVASLFYTAICLSHFLSALITLPLILVVVLTCWAEKTISHPCHGRPFSANFLSL
ncbi:MAG: glycosyltransferase family 39 protein [Chloroflexi bacterium]|nr:glycosyltransferase family 39 protein [Chloroflexota bacterium]